MTRESTLDLKGEKLPTTVRIKDAVVPGVTYRLAYADHRNDVTEKQTGKWADFDATALEDTEVFKDLNSISEYIQKTLPEKQPWVKDFAEKSLSQNKPLFGVDMYISHEVGLQEILELTLRNYGAYVAIFSALIFPSAARSLKNVLNAKMTKRDAMKLLGGGAALTLQAYTIPAWLQDFVVEISTNPDQPLDEGTVLRRIQRFSRTLEENVPGINPTLLIVAILRDLTFAYKLRAAGRIQLARRKEKSTEICFPVGAMHFGVEKNATLSDKDLLNAINTLIKSRPEVTEQMKESIFKLPEITRDSSGLKVTIHQLPSSI